MRIPLDWLSQSVKLPKNLKGLTDKLTLAGHMLDRVDRVDGNPVIDLELRGNRADCYSIIGIAREIAALFGTKVSYPRINTKLKKVAYLREIRLDVKTTLVKRVMITEVRDVKIGPSPNWLKEKLTEYGIPTINNIVDLTNYIMIETGEPMHAFDLDKLGGALVIRLAKDGEKMTTFLGNTLTLTSEDLVWANSDSVLSVAGAIGAKERSISGGTKNVLLEAANYNRANIRRSIYRHNLFTDAGIRHEKELDPNIVEIAIGRFCDIVTKEKWGKVIPEASDFYPKKVLPWKLELSFDYLDSLSGLKIDRKIALKILKSLGFEIVKSTKEKVEVLVPTVRTDVRLEEDLIEEVLRIFGYDKIPTRTLSLEVPKESTPGFVNQELEVKNILVSLGFDEIISSSFIAENFLKYNKVIQEKVYLPVKVANRPSPDVEELRMSLFPNLLALTQRIFNERGTEAFLFEVGKVYLKDGKNYIEKRKLGIMFSQGKVDKFPFFKGFLESILTKLNLDSCEFDEEEIGTNYLRNTYKISLGEKVIGYGGNFGDIFFAEIDLDSILGKSKSKKAELWPKYPPQIEDITLNIPQKTKVGEVLERIKNYESRIVNVELKYIYENAYTFRVWYQSPKKTLTDEEVEKIRSKILSELKEKFGAIS